MSLKGSLKLTDIQEHTMMKYAARIALVLLIVTTIFNKNLMG